MAITLSSAIRGGLAGAGAVTLINEAFRKINKETPRLEALGLNVVAKVVNGVKGVNQSDRQKLIQIPIAGHILTNTLYFSLAGLGSKKNVVLRSALLGLTAGLGTLILPNHLGLSSEANNRTIKTKVTTIAGYFLGSMIAAAAIRGLQKKGTKQKPTS